MNFLAHLYLSHDTREARAGNVLADFVRGDAERALPEAVRAGIRQHRAVDGFTDRHTRVRDSLSRLGPDRREAEGKIGSAWRRWGGVVLDVYYDHLLARDWANWSNEPLRAYCDRMYVEMRAAAPWAGPEVAPHILAFCARDQLHRNATQEGVAETLTQLSRRIAARAPHRLPAVALHDAMEVLAANDGALLGDFRAMFPDLIAFARAC